MHEIGLKRAKQVCVSRQRGLRESWRRSSPLAASTCSDRARTGDYHAGSDLDLAVEGLPQHEYLAALERLTEEASLPVDLVDLAEANERATSGSERGEGTI